MNEFDVLIGKLIKLTYTDLDGEEVVSIGKILYTLKNRAFVFQSEEDCRQTIVYNRHVTKLKELHAFIDEDPTPGTRLADQS